MTEKNYHHGDLKNALIKAGIDILAHEGVYGLTLRKVARKAGVSHTAPYSHFADKQGLIAAISTEGYNNVSFRLEQVLQTYQQDGLELLANTAWSYVQFALAEPDLFKITFSGVVEKEADYPALVVATQKCYRHLEQVVQICQADGVLRPGSLDLEVLSVWGCIHGCVLLCMEGQISHTIMERNSWAQIISYALGQLCQVPVPSDILAG